MTIEEYFGDWCSIIDTNEVKKIIQRLLLSKSSICPNLKDIFKAFRLCPLHNVRTVLIGQDPYFTYRDNKPVATGLAFANSSDTPKEKYSPSLEVLKESIINFSMPHNRIIFDPSLEKWEEQGVLLLNTALSCEKGKPSSHMLLWRPFITSLIANLSKYTSGIVYVLMGSSAQSLEPYIGKNNYIIRCRHPSYYARTHTKMPSSIWQEINNILIGQNGYGIEWYKENKIKVTEKNEEVFC